jgi:glutamate-ammonia-ligase adenylyltransferase
LAWAHKFPELLRYTDNIRLLEGLAQAGAMVSGDAEILSDIYRVYRARVHQLTLLRESTVVDAQPFAEHREAVLRIWRTLFETDR